MEDSTLSRIRKIRELALKGVAGEKEGAQKILEELVKKYHLEDYDFDEEEVKDFDLSFHGKYEKKLLLQIYFKVTNKTTIYNLINRGSGRKIKTQVRVSCTEAQKVEIEFLLDFYKRLWTEEVDLLMEAFIQKHKLFGDAEPENQPEYDIEKLNRMFKLMRGLREEVPLKQLESADD